MNIPNLLTMIRLLLIPVYICVYFSQQPHRILWAIAVLFLSSLTDIADGYWARRMRQVTELGEVLDPLADKLMTVAVFLCLFFDAKVSAWEAGAVIFRDAAMILYGVYLRSRGVRTLPANTWGKVATLTLSMVLVGLMLSWPGFHVALWCVTLLLYAAAGVYMWNVHALNGRSKDIAVIEDKGR